MKTKPQSKMIVTELTNRYKVQFCRFDKGAILMLKERVPFPDRDYDGPDTNYWFINKRPQHLKALQNIAEEYFELGEFIIKKKDGDEFYDLKTMIKVAEQPLLY